jgi:hypothetical protein
MRRTYFVLLPLLLTSFACENSSMFEPSLDMTPEMGRVHGADDGVTVAVPFKARFSVWDHSDYTDEQCGGNPNFLVTMKGAGTATHLGKLSTSMTFCCNVLSGAYWDTEGSLVAANGDSLFIEIPNGLIVPNEGDDSDYYQTKFNDPAFFVGGTGRFEGATGSWQTNAFVHNGTDEWRTDLFSTGTLILERR